jgi:hypothetical protein
VVLLELSTKAITLSRVALSKGALANMSNEDREKIAAELEQLAEGPSLTIDMQFAYRHAARVVRG